MHQPQFLRRFGLTLIIGAMLLPVCICVTLGVAVLLEGMDDIVGGVVLRRIVLAGSILWVIDLVCLLLVLAIGSLRGPDEPDEP